MHLRCTIYPRRILQKHILTCKGPRYGDSRGCEKWFCEICDKELFGQIEIRDHPHTLLEFTNYNHEDKILKNLPKKILIKYEDHW